MKLVSIIVSIDKDCSVLDRCYNSLINQIYNNIEIIFINNSNNIDIKNTYVDKRLIIINSKNMELSNIIDIGLKKSIGEYIIFIDCYDRLSKDYIYKLVNSIEKYNSNISIGKSSNGYLRTRNRVRKIDIYEKKEYLSVLSIDIYGKLFRRDILNKYKFKDGRDIYSIYINSRYISFVNNTIYYRYIDNNSRYRDNLLGDMLDYLKYLRYIYCQLELIDKLEDYYYEVEMMFIKNISFIIYNLKRIVDDKIYRYKFMSVILDYLEYFFPDWDVNPYYVRGFKIGDITDIYYVRNSYDEICKIKRKKLNLSIDLIYDKYNKILDMYNKSK